MDELNNLLQQAAANYSRTPPARVWEAVERDLDQRKKRRRILILWWWVLGVLLALLSCYYLFAIAPGKKTAVVRTDRAVRPESAVAVPPIAPPQQAIAGKGVAKSEKLKRGVQEGSSRTNGIEKLIAAPPRIATASPLIAASAKAIPLPKLSMPKAVPMEVQAADPVVRATRASEPDMHALALKQAARFSATAPALQGPNLSRQEIQERDIQTVAESVAYDAEAVPMSVLNAIDQRALAGNGTIAPELTIAKDQPMAPVIAAIASTADTAPEVQMPPDTLHLSNELPYKKAVRWSISAGVSSVRSTGRVTGADSITAAITDYRNESSQRLRSTGYHIRAGYRVIPSLELYTGIGMHTIGEQLTAAQRAVRLSNIILSQTVELTPYYLSNDSNGYIDNQYQYLELPLGVKLQVLQWKRLHLTLDAGVVFNKLQRAEGYTYDSTSNVHAVVEQAQVKPWLMAYNGGFGLRYDLLPSWAIEVSPWWRYYPGSIFKSDVRWMQQYYSQAGVSFMLRYTMRRTASGRQGSVRSKEYPSGDAALWKL